MRTTVYLDVDGVINAVSAKPPKQNTQWFGEWSKVEALGFPILFSHELIDGLNDLADRDGVTVKWLTTWQEEAPEKLAPLLGLNGQDWEVLYGNVNDHPFTTGRWWKLNAISDDVDRTSPDKVVWIDDDIMLSRDSILWCRDHDVFIAAPNTSHGMTKKQLSGIIDFINES